MDNAAAGGDADTGSGGQVTIPAAALTAPDNTTINGGGDVGNAADADTFHIVPQVGSAITVYGENPILPADPGDTLILDLTGLNPPTLSVFPGQGNGQVLFNGPWRRQGITYWSIETFDTVNGPDAYHLLLDTTIAGFGGDGTADDIRLSLKPNQTDLIVERTGDAANGPVGVLFTGNIGDILSFTLQGSGDNDSLTIDDSNNLPVFAGTLPRTPPDNPNIVDVPSVLFEGAGGTNTLALQFGIDAADQSYAVGDGQGDGFNADLGLAQGEILTGGASGSLDLYFTGLS